MSIQNTGTKQPDNLLLIISFENFFRHHFLRMQTTKLDYLYKMISILKMNDSTETTDVKLNVRHKSSTTKIIQFPIFTLLPTPVC